MVPSPWKGVQGSISSGVSPRRRLERIPPYSSVATHRALFADATERRCDLCDTPIVGESGGSGLYVWARGPSSASDAPQVEVRYEEPPLCRLCGPSLAMVATRRWEEEEDEEG